MRITSIERNVRRRRYELHIDGERVISLSKEVLAGTDLRPGQELTEAGLRALESAEARHFAMATALRQLAYRPRSEKEMSDALRRRGVGLELAQETLSRLLELGLLDDADFARSYVDLRNRTGPRSRRLLRSELSSRGVQRAAAEPPVAEVDEADAAYRAAARRARSLSKLSFPEFQRRVGDHMIRRGFGYQLARETVRRLWLEVGGEEPAADGVDESALV